MKKKVLVCTLFLLLIFPVLASAEHTPISKNDALHLAQDYFHNYFTECTDLTEAEINATMEAYRHADAFETTMSNGQEAWAVSYMGDMDDERYFNNIYTLFLDRYTGKCLYISRPEVVNPIAKEHGKLIMEKGPFVSWSLEEKYDFHQEFSKKYADFLAIAHEENYVPVGDYLLRLISYDFRMPDENCISEDDAIEYATVALKKQETLSDEHIADKYVIETSFLFSNEYLEDGNLVWKIFFIPAPPVSPDYGYYVEIDAYNGETLGITHQIQSQENPWALKYE